MVINWIPLIIALLFGLIPPRLLIKGEVRFLGFEDLWLKAIRPPHGEHRRRRWWKLPLVWIDPIRGLVTAHYLLEAFPKPLRGSGQTAYPHLSAIAVTLWLCLWMQTLGRRRSGETISPTGFLAGMIVILLPYEVAVPVLVVGFSTVIAVRDYNFGYYAAALMCAGFGYFFMGFSLNLIAPMGLLLLPVVVNWLRGTRLVVPVRC
jgi:hypothetical protein